MTSRLGECLFIKCGSCCCPLLLREKLDLLMFDASCLNVSCLNVLKLSICFFSSCCTNVLRFWSIFLLCYSFHMRVVLKRTMPTFGFIQHWLQSKREFFVMSFFYTKIRNWKGDKTLDSLMIVPISQKDKRNCRFWWWRLKVIH